MRLRSSAARASLIALSLLALAPGAPARGAVLEPSVAPSVSGSYREGGSVVATPGTWPGPEPAFTYQWQRCDAAGDRCSTVSGRTQPSYTPVAADVNGTLRVQVTATSTEGAGQATSAPSGVITGTPPSNTNAAAIVGHPRLGQTLTVDPRTWTGTQPIAFAYRWSRCDAAGQACTVLAGQTASTYLLSAPNLGRRLQVRITATNPSGQTVIHTPLTPVIGQAAPPVAAGAPALAGTARDGDTLTVSRGTWTGADPMAYAYRWLRCSALDATACSPIPAQTAGTYKLTGADLGSVVRAEVTATNPDGAAAQQSAPSAPVAPAPPTTISPPSIIGQAREGQVLTGSRNTWTGTPTITYAYEWRRCVEDGCTAIPGATTTSYRLAAADVGARVTFVVLASNQGGSAERSSAPTRVVAATAPPAMTTPPTVAGVARDGQPLTSTNGTWSGLAARYSHQWLRCAADGSECAPVAGATTSGYKLSPADIGATIRLRVTATNEDGTAQATSEPHGPIAAIPPSSVPPALSGTPAEGGTLTAVAGAWGGSPPIRLAYAWLRCAPDGTGCQVVPDAETSTYPLTPDDIGRRIRVRVTGTNAGGSVAAESALSAPVTGTPPAAPNPGPAITGVARDGETLAGDRGVWRGTAPITFTRQWQRCTSTGGACASIPGATGATYEATAADHGATLRLRVEATNAYGSRSADSPVTPVVAPAPPAVVVRPSIGGVREDGATLTADPGTWTGTAPLAYAYRWERADPLTGAWAAIPGATGTSHVLSSEDVGTSLRLHVTVTNAAARPVSSTSAATAAIAAVPPRAVEPPTVAGTARDAATLTGDPGRWAGTEPMTRRLRWLRCDAGGGSCAAIDGETAPEYRLTPDDIGQTLRLSVAMSNAATGSAPVVVRSERTPVVVPDPPANRVLPTILGTPRDGRTLSVERGEWTGTPAIGFAYRWHRCTVVTPVRCAPIDGATGATYVLRSADIGTTIRVELAASNAGGTGHATSAATAVVTGSPPVNAEPPAVTGTPYDGEVLEAAPGRWTGTVPFAYDYRWHRCDRFGGNCGVVGGAVASTYRVGSADLGYRIRLEVVARNPGGSASAFAAPTAVATPRPPRFLTQPAVSGRPGVGQTLTGTDGTWEGTPPLTVTRQWRRCNPATAACTAIAGATAPTYRLTAADAGSRVRLQVTVQNAAGGAGAVASSPATEIIRDDPPVNVELPAIGTPGAVAVSLALTASPGRWNGGPPMEPEYQWRRCDAAGACADIPGATGERYVPVPADLGTRLRVAVRMDNGAGAATAVSAVAGPVLGPPPSATALPVVTVRGLLRAGSELTATPGTWAGAGPITYGYAWLRCDAAGDACAPVPGATAFKHVLTDADVGRVMKVRVTATNATSAVGAESAPTGRVAPLPPALTGLVTVAVEGGGRLKPGARLIGDAGSWAGTAPVALAGRWQRCPTTTTCEDIHGAAGLAYTLTEGDVGQRLRLVVSASNVAGSATAASLPTDAVSPSPPANVEVPAVSGTPHDGELLEGTIGRWTGAEPFTYEYRWYRCDRLGGSCALIVGAAAPAHRVGADDIGYRIRLEVVARNAGGTASAFAVPTAAATPRPPRVLSPPAVTGRHGAGQTLTGSDGTWEGTAPLTTTREWLRCNPVSGACAPILGATGGTYRLTSADVGSRIRLRVLVDNAAAGAAAARSRATLIVRDDPPVNAEAPALAASGPVAVGVPLTASPGRWTGGPPLQPQFQWRRCDANGACADIPGATAARYAPVPGDLGAHLRAAVTMDNGVGTATAQSAAAGPVLGAPPAATILPAVTLRGAPRPGGELMATTGTWTGAAPLTYTHAWLRCAVTGDACVPIPGATAPKHVLTDADVDRVLKVRITAVNATTAVSAESAATDRIEPLPPANRALPAVLGTPHKGRTLTVDRGTWVGTPAIAYAYRWQRCTAATPVSCAPIEGVAGASYVLRAADVGWTVRVEVTATNAGGTAAATSPPSAAVADPPVNAELPAVTGDAHDGELLEGTIGRWTGAQPFTYEYRWHRCDRLGGSCGLIEGAEAATYRVGADDMGYRIRFEVVAGNAGGTASAFATPTAVATPRPPQFLSDPSVSGHHGIGKTLTGADGTWSGTAPLSVTRAWLRCDPTSGACVPIAGASAREYRLTAADVGSRVRLRVRVDNAAPGDGATARSSATPVIRDDPPASLEPPAVSSAGPVAVGVALTAAPGTWEGGPPMEPAFQWRRCDADGECREIDGATAARYVPVAADLGSRLRVTVSMDNGAGAATAQSEPVGPVLGAPPAATALPAVTVRGEPRPGTELTATAGTWTGAAPLVYTHAWLRCDLDGTGCAPVPGATGARHVLTDADVGHVVRVRVTATNGTSAVAARSLPTERVEPLPPAAGRQPAIVIESGGRPSPGSRLVGDAGDWAGTAPVALAGRWQRCTSPLVTTCEDVPGASGLAYTATEADVGRRLRLVIDASNGGGSATAASVLTEVVTGSAPANVRAPAVRLAAGAALADGARLEADPGEWGGTAPVAFAYEWQRCPADPAASGDCAAISRVTGTAYTLGADDVGRRIRVRVTATNAAGRAQASAEPTAPVAAVAPVASAPPTVDRPPGVLKAGSRLTARPGEWAGTKPVVFAYRWLRCNKAGEGCEPLDRVATAVSLALVAADFAPDGTLIGTLRAEVTASNPGGAVAARSEPVAQAAAISPKKKATAGEPSPDGPGVPHARVRFSSARRFAARVTCPKGTIPCKGRLAVKSRPFTRTIAFALKPGKSRRWSVKLRPAERRALGRVRRLKVKLTVAAEGQPARTRARKLKIPR